MPAAAALDTAKDKAVRSVSADMAELSAADATPEGLASTPTPQASSVIVSANDTMSYDTSTKTLTVFADCRDAELYNFWRNNASDVETLRFEGTLVITTTASFYGGYGMKGCSSLKSIVAASGTRVSFLSSDASYGTPIYQFFQNCFNLTDISGLSSWDVSNVTGGQPHSYCMGSLFRGCSSLTALDALSGWDVSNVSGNSCMANMFQDCSSLASLEGLSNWNVSGARNASFSMQYMFSGCSGLTSLEGLSNWDVSGVKGTACMVYMFSGCTGLTSLEGLASWDVSNVNGSQCMRDMFSGCSSLASIDAISTWNLSRATALDGVKDMFAGCPIASITLGGSSGLQLDSSMGLPNASDVYWFPVNSTVQTPVALDTADLITESSQNPPSSYRWQRCSGPDVDPRKAVTSLNAGSWTEEEEKTFNGCNQQFNPEKIEATLATNTTVVLAYGTDYTVTYTTSANETPTSSVRDAGTYTATIVLRGAYVAGTGYEALTSTKKITPLDLSSSNVFAYCAPDTFSYDGTAKTPSVTLRIYLDQGEEHYSDLPAQTGDFTVTYSDNINIGTGSAKVSPANGNLSENTYAYFDIGAICAVLDASSSTLTFEVLDEQPPTTEGTDWWPVARGGYSATSKPGWVSQDITTVTFDSSFSNYKPISLAYWFANMDSLETLNNEANLETSQVSDISSMFAGDTALTELDLSGFDTTNVGDMDSLFSGCSNLSTLTLGKKSLLQEGTGLPGLNNATNPFWIKDIQTAVSYDTTEADAVTNINAILSGLAEGSSQTFTKASMRLTYNANGGSFQQGQTTTDKAYLYGNTGDKIVDSTATPAFNYTPVPTRPNYSYAGYATTEEGTTDETPSVFPAQSANATFYAIWTELPPGPGPEPTPDSSGEAGLIPVTGDQVSTLIASLFSLMLLAEGATLLVSRSLSRKRRGN